MDTAAAPAAPNIPEMGSWARLIGALINPRPTFESIVRRPTWVLPVALGMVLFLAIVAVFSQRGGWPAFFQRQDANSNQFQKMSQDQQEKAYQAQLKFAPPVAYVEGVILPILVPVIVAALFLGVFNLGASAQMRFGVALGIVAFAWTPWLIHGLVSVLILFLKDPATVDLQNLVASNPGAFLAEDSPKWLSALLSSLDIFAIWTVILLAIGFSAANPKKLSFGKSLSFVIVIWVLFIGLKVGLTALFS